jgi:ferredoxin
VTPFGIRKRLKKLFGLEAAPPKPKAPPAPRYEVQFELPDDTSYTAKGKSGDTLSRISGRGPRPLATGCADTSCGTCAVEIIEGVDMVTEASEHELLTKAANQVPEQYRLACATAITGEGVVVKVFAILGEEAA